MGMVVDATERPEEGGSLSSSYPEFECQLFFHLSYSFLLSVHNFTYVYTC